MKFIIMIIFLTVVNLNVRVNADGETLPKEALRDYNVEKLAPDVKQTLEVRTADGGQTFHGVLTEENTNVTDTRITDPDIKAGVNPATVTTKVVETFPNCAVWTVTQSLTDAFHSSAPYEVTIDRNDVTPDGIKEFHQVMRYSYKEYQGERKRELKRQLANLQAITSDNKKLGSKNCWADVNFPTPGSAAVKKTTSGLSTTGQALSGSLSPNNR